MTMLLKRELKSDKRKPPAPEGTEGQMIAKKALTKGEVAGGDCDLQLDSRLEELASPPARSMCANLHSK